MTQLAWAMLAGLLALGCSVLGYRLGARRILSAALRPGLCWILAACTAATGYNLHWFWPFGLVTPIIAGALSSAWLWRSLRPRDLGDTQTQRPSPPARWTGMLLGTWAGLALATLILLNQAVFAGSDPSSSEATSHRWISSLVTTVNRGFVRHLPLIGSYGDEVEALVYILNADPLTRRRLARQQRWRELARLPAMQDAMADDEVRAEIDAVAGGSVFALYRLQRHPRIIALVECEEMARCIDGLRPSKLAAELRHGTPLATGR